MLNLRVVDYVVGALLQLHNCLKKSSIQNTLNTEAKNRDLQKGGEYELGKLQIRASDKKKAL